jgi:hypothetical protein
MLDGVFSRFGSQFREGCVIHAKFAVTAGPIFTAKSTRPASSHRKLTLVKNGGTGLLRLTLSGGAREIALLGNPVYVNIADPTDVTDNLKISPVAAINETTGVIDFVSVTGDGSEAAADAAVGDEIHITLYVAK